MYKPTYPAGHSIRGYRVLEFIGKGLSGEVYRAQHEIHGVVALKVLLDDADATVATYFGNEHLLLREITRHRQHPRIVEYVASAQDRPPHFLSTRYVDGRGKLELLLGRPLSPGYTLRLVDQLANALDYLHLGHPRFSPIIHRDVKPQNILINPRGDAVLIDLSIARYIGHQIERPHRLATWRYSPLEQHAGQEVPSTDQFALAAVTHHMLTGSALLPQKREDAYEKLLKLKSSNYEEVRRQMHAWPQTAEVLIQALHHDPEQRYRTCEAFAYYLRRALAEDGVPVDEDAPPASLPPLSIMLLGGLALFAVLILVAAFIFVH